MNGYCSKKDHILNCAEHGRGDFCPPECFLFGCAECRSALESEIRLALAETEKELNDRPSPLKYEIRYMGLHALNELEKLKTKL